MPGLDAALAGVKTWMSQNILLDTVRIELPATGEPVLDPATGNLTRPSGETLYEGPGAVQGGTAQAETSATPGALPPGRRETKPRHRLLTPLEAPIAPKDAIVTVAQVQKPADAALTGRRWTCQ